MNLQGRSLDAGMQGTDVQVLQSELQRLGFAIADDETGRQLFGDTTRRAVITFQQTRGVPGTGEVDDATAKLINVAVDALRPTPAPAPTPAEPPTGLLVRGMVRLMDGSAPFTGIVRAFDVDLRTEVLLGEVATSDGSYQISYDTSKLARPGKRRADLIVRAFSRDGATKLAESALLFDTGPQVTVDLVVGGPVYQGPSEYERLLTTITPLLRDVRLADLKEDDVGFLAGETGIDPAWIAFAVVADRLHQAAGLPPELFYGFARQGLSTDLGALLSQDPDVLLRALDAALDANIVPGRLGDARVDIPRLLQQLVVRQMLQPYAPDESSLGALLDTVPLQPDLQQAFVSAYMANTAPIDQFWQTLRQDPGFQQAGLVDSLQFTLQLGALTQNHVPLVRQLRAMQQEGRLRSARDLAKLDIDDWLALIEKHADGQTVGVPPGIPGDAPADQAKNYATSLAEAVADAFPTAVIANRLARETTARDNLELVQFFDQNPDFDFAREPLDVYLGQRGGVASAGLTEPEMTRLRTIERVFRMTPRYDQMKFLLEGGVESAQGVTRMGRENFVARFGDRLGGTAVAADVYENAAQTAATALAVFARYTAQLNSIGLSVLPSGAVDPTALAATGTAALPDWRTLFGSLDLCACEDCRSVNSPAAYLVDLLAFLKTRVSKLAGKSGVDVLLDRRPDIGDLKLTCANTNITVPTIDLVNEVLEQQVSPGTHQLQTETIGTAAELLANPQYTNVGAYEVVRQQVYPWILPFDLWRAEASVYLGHLGVKRHELMRAFQTPPPAPGTAADPPAAAIAAEYLGLTDVERQIITGAPLTPARAGEEFWGYQPGTAGWTADVVHVPRFLQRSGLSYAQLQDLLRTRFINPDGMVTLSSTDPATCDLSQITIANLPEVGLSRIHRFVRLLRRVGWSMRELDRAIVAFKVTDLNDDLLRKLADVQRLRATSGVPLIELLSWWERIDTAGDGSGGPSLYERIFQNKAVAAIVKATAGQPDPFELNDARDELKVVGKLSDPPSIGPALLAALGIGSSELALLTTGPDKVVSGDVLNLDNLSRLYRSVSLARALKLAVPDLLSVRALTGIDPFDRAHTEATVRFVDTIGRISDSSFSILELSYLLRHAEQAASALAPSRQVVDLLLGQIHEGLQKAAVDNAVLPDPTGELTRRKLALVLDAALVDRAMALIDGTSTEEVDDQKTFVDDNFGRFLHTETAKNDAKDKLIGEHAIKNREARFAYVLKPLSDFLREQASQNLVVRTLADALGLDVRMATPLLTKWVQSPDGGQPAITAITEFLQETSGRYDTFIRLKKVANVITKPRLRLTVDELEWLFSDGVSAGLLDCNRLPVAEVTAPDELARLFGSWERLVSFAALRDGLPQRPPSLVEIFKQSDSATRPEGVENLLALVARRTGWDVADLKFLVGPQGLALTLPDAFKDERALVRLKTCFDLLARLGVPARQAKEWSKSALQAADSQAAKQAAKAKYDEAGWLAVAPSLRNPLREQQRDALVGFLVARGGLADANALYERLLVDVEMSACQTIPRIGQAIASVQLFVQRALMGLEADLGLTADDANQWKWMKRYREWEANRKVFLYPENWIEPEQRDDKSPFFQELENTLLQTEITNETAEAAYRAYLEKLDEVARLEICGAFHQQEPATKTDPSVDILHVFGRTHGDPHVYYYRQWVHSAYWTAWQKVDLDIQGDHLLPVVYRRRLYLLWPIFTEATRNQSPPTDSKNAAPPKKHWEIQLAWSEYRHNKWSARKVSHTLAWPTPGVDVATLRKREKFLFKVLPGSELRVRCYQEDPQTSTKPIADFAFTGCDGTVVIQNADSNYQYVLTPSGTEIHYMGFQSTAGTSQLTLLDASPGKEFLPTDDYDTLKGKRHDRPVLGRTHATYRLQPRHQDYQFVQAVPFFFEDDTKTFFVTPATITPTTLSWADRSQVTPAVVGQRVAQRMQAPPPAPIVAVAPGLVAVNGGRYLGPAPVGVPIPGPVPEDHEAADPSPLVEAGTLFAMVGPPQAIGSSGPSIAASWGDSTLSPWNSGMVVAAMDGRTAEAASSRGLVMAGDALGLRTREAVEASMRALGVSSILATLPTEEIGAILLGRLATQQGYRFSTFYHPYVCDFVERLNRGGLEGILRRTTQQKYLDYFDKTEIGYAPQQSVVAAGSDYPREEVEFDYGGGYSQYNWELFFHAPLLIADRLTRNQRFDEARRWFHFIFDPLQDASTGDPPVGKGAQRYWKVRPFFEDVGKLQALVDGPIQVLLELLGYSGPDKVRSQARQELENQVRQWRKDPFKPHLIARLRTSAYQKRVVMKYLDMLIAWGDQLFHQESMESINQATLLYVLAAEILGEPPEEIPPRASAAPKSYRDLAPSLDAFSDAVVKLENLVPPPTRAGSGSASGSPILLSGTALYFCITNNDRLLKYWDDVADRLSKVRHCMTLAGVVRQVPPWAPPISPELLVQAAAAGVDLGSALADLNAPLPYYRFTTMVQKATELCNDLRGLGGALLAALEKRDAEALALLRANQEVMLLKAVRDVKQQQVDEATRTLEGLQRSRELVEIRYQYYRDIAYLNDGEKAHLALSAVATTLQAIGQFSDLAASVVRLIPEIDLGVSGISSPVVKARWGGANMAGALEAFSKYMHVYGTLVGAGASMSQVIGGYARRWDDWKLQESLAAKEREQLDSQVLAAQVRKAIADREKQNHDLQIEHAKTDYEYLRDKFTGGDLYDWMVSQISTVYFQAYQMTYDLAKRAEKAYQLELGSSQKSFIQFGYWDSLKKGLLAGEKLAYDLKRMELDYLDQHRREYEITKHVSLAILNPVALVRLKETGQCIVDVPEALFDLDYPGHYMRRIKSVSLTIPCVAGPYTGINCTLTLLSNKVRTNNSLLEQQYPRKTEGGDPRFADNVVSIQSIVTSSAQNDSGAFELSFRDERYLPFEYAGAISQWRIELPVDTNRFDFSTISDVILHLKYTARDGGGTLKNAARAAVVATPPGELRVRLFSAKHEFSTEWYRFLHPGDSETGQTLHLLLGQDRFPFLTQKGTIWIRHVQLYLKLKDVTIYGSANTGHLELALRAPGADPPVSITFERLTFEGDTAPSGVLGATADFTRPSQPETNLGEWLLVADEDNVGKLAAALQQTVDGHKRLNPDAFQDLAVVCWYSVG